MNLSMLKTALAHGLITKWEHDFYTAIHANTRRWKRARNANICRTALYDKVKTAPGDARPITLREIGEHFGLPRERVRQIINAGISDDYPLIVSRRRTQKLLYQKTLKAARRSRSTVYLSGTRKGKTRPEYTAYRAMPARCYNPRNPNYPNYGARGVTVCDRWLGEYGWENFLADMGRRPARRHRSGRAAYSIHWIDNALVYRPESCKWATQREQCAEGQRRRPDKRCEHND